MPSFLSRSWQSTRSLLTNKYFLGGLGVLLLVGAAFYVLLNYVVMPIYTKHDVAVTVPDVMDRSFEEAQQILASYELRAERQEQVFNPSLPPDVVVEQNPPQQTRVKPGRRIFLTVNSGTVPMVTVPNVKNLSLREAVNRITALDLEVGETIPDSIPSPYRNTITRQSPAPGDSIRKGTAVTLWYSTGLGDAYVSVPDLVGMPVAEAQQVLQSRKLRSVVFLSPDAAEGEEDQDVPEPPEEPQWTPDMIVQGQSREPGTRVREGFELRLYVSDEPVEDPAAPEESAPDSF